MMSNSMRLPWDIGCATFLPPMTVKADPLSLHGRVALVTGAGHGIGAATASAFARAGALVAVLDRDGDSATRTARDIRLAGHEALPFTADVTDAFAVETMVARIVEEWGRLDILVNQAGVVRESRLDDLTDEDWALTLDVNLRGPWICCRTAVPHMLRRGHGRILSATSTAARDGLPGGTALAAATAGVIGMTRTWARELGPHGITANAVAPGYIEGVQSLPETARAEIAARTPAGRLGRPEDVA